MTWIDPLWNEKLNSPNFSDLAWVLTQKVIENSIPDGMHEDNEDAIRSYEENIFELLKNNSRYQAIESYNKNKEF